MILAPKYNGVCGVFVNYGMLKFQHEQRAQCRGSIIGRGANSPLDFIDNMTQLYTQPDLFTTAKRDESYRQLLAKGLSPSYEKVINALRILGKGDYHMIAEVSGLPVTSVTGRVKELRNNGMIDVAGAHVGKYGKEITLYEVV